MISKHVNNMLNKITSSKAITCLLDDHFEEYKLQVNMINLTPELGSDIVLELSNGKLITVNDLEFSELSSDTLILGHYTFSIES